MWIVRLALERPYTFAVMSLLIVVLGVAAISQMRTDIFPEIDIPVVTVIWTFKGMDSAEVERRITTYSEYAFSSNVNDIKRMESQTLKGVAVIKIFFHLTEAGRVEGFPKSRNVRKHTYAYTWINPWLQRSDRRLRPRVVHLEREVT